jgi:hypothetical protein
MGLSCAKLRLKMACLLRLHLKKTLLSKDMTEAEVGGRGIHPLTPAYLRGHNPFPNIFLTTLNNQMNRQGDVIHLYLLVILS